MDSLSFRIPEQHPPTEGSFDTRAMSVQQWIDELPRGHTGETAKRLYEMLSEVNALAIPLKVRFELMEMVSQPLEEVFNALERHFSGMPFPLPVRSVRVAQFSSQMLAKAVIAYQAILDGEEGASWFFRKTHNQMWLVSVQRIVRYLNRILHNYRLIHRHHPPGVWQALHRLYRTARDHGRLHDKVPDPFDTGRRVTIEKCYKRGLLLAMLEPQLFRREQMAQVLQGMEHWLSAATLLAAAERPEGTMSYCIRADADVPHTTLSGSCCGDCEDGEAKGILLDLSALSALIDDHLQKLGEGETLRLKGGAGEVSRETLELLAQSWRVPMEQREERLATHKGVAVAIGMSAIHRLLKKGVKQSAHGISDQQLSDRVHDLSWERIAPGARPGSGKVMGERAEKDIWKTIFSATEITQKAWVAGADERDYEFVPAEERNYNSTGYCIAFDKSGLESLQVGELIGLQGNEGKALELCEVRWISEEEKTLSAGVRMLAAEVEPVLLVLHSDERKTALDCLLGIGEDHQPQVFVPFLPGLKGKQLTMVVDEHEVPIALHERVALSPLFEAYYFQVAELSGSESFSLDELNERLHNITHGTGRGGSQERDFSDLWHTL